MGQLSLKEADNQLRYSMQTSGIITTELKYAELCQSACWQYNGKLMFWLSMFNCSFQVLGRPSHHEHGPSPASMDPLTCKHGPSPDPLTCKHGPSHLQAWSLSPASMDPLTYKHGPSPASMDPHLTLSPASMDPHLQAWTLSPASMDPNLQAWTLTCKHGP